MRFHYDVKPVAASPSAPAAMRAASFTLLAVALAAGGALAADPDPRYRTAIEAWRAAREAELKADDGWLTVAGLFWLKEGAASFGSADDNAIVLPASAAARCGVFERRGARITVRVEAGVPATLAGRAFSQGELRAAGPGRPPDVLAIGSLSMFVIERGGRYGIRLRDTQSPNRGAFEGLRWFPVDPRYRVEAHFTAHPAERRITIANVLGDVTPMRSPGVASFVLEGKTFALEPVYESDDSRELFFIFKDATAGRGTYGAGRFLYSDPPRDGRVILDFNKAQNPPCAYTAFATCPLPPRQNVLPVRIEAGERIAGH